MTSGDTTAKKAFHGWFTLAGAILVTVVSGGAFIVSFGVFLPVICDEMGWSRASLSLALSLGILAFGLPGPLYGLMVNTLGPRRCIIIGNVLAAAVTAALFTATRTWHYYLLYTVIGLGNGIGGYIACTTLANNWFIKKRTLVMGVFSASAGLAGFIFPPVVTALIEGFSFRIAWFFLAGFVMFGSVILGGVVLIRNRPEDVGQLPDGDYSVPDITVKPDHSPGNPSPGWRTGQILKTRTIWMIAGFVFADALAMGTVVAHQIAYVQDIGFNPMVAASVASSQSIFTIAGGLMFGALSLKLNMRYLAAWAFLLQVIGMIILLTTRSLVFIYVYAAFTGLGLGAVFTAMATFVGAYYPREHYAQVMGMVLPFYVVGQSISALGVGAIFDATGQYTLAFGILAVCLAGGLVCTLRARPPKQLSYGNSSISDG